MLLLVTTFFCFTLISANSDHQHKFLRSRRQYPMTHWPPPNATRTRSLSNTYATDGDETANSQIYNLLTRTITQGFTTWRIKQFNDRVWLDRYRRSFWFGQRYYRLDNRYWLETRDTCAYELDPVAKSQLHYEEPNPGSTNIQIHEIIYQCQRYVEYCCGLRCCRNEDLFKKPEKQRHMRNPWDYGSEVASIFTSKFLLFPMISYLFLN
ncbi:unnamed protein product, partial [Mesorhabditis belari]|uniref:CX domain-containing protein n=1 Tax=Mesorhabditis belari TaxID=2138241 RepID=A0AAF3EIA2_9BILA